MFDKHYMSRAETRDGVRSSDWRPTGGALTANVTTRRRLRWWWEVRLLAE